MTNYSAMIKKLVSSFIASVVLVSNLYSQSPSFSRDSGSKYVSITKHANNGDFFNVAQLRVGQYLTLGNFGKTNQSWIGNNAILDYSSYNDLGSQGNTNKFVPVYENGTAFIMVPNYNNGSLGGFIHHWNGSTTSQDFDTNTDSKFREIWRLNENNSFITSSLNIGGKSAIGNATLSVEGITVAREYIAVNNGSSYRIAINGQNHGYLTARDNNGDQKLLLSTEGNSFFDGGKVGIGTLSPDEILTVDGNIHTTGFLRSTEVVVEASASQIPDYVFQPDYDLMPLEEVEAYVKANSHLPEVPSAEEVEADGHKLAEMNLLLLKKIEELTLHTIKQEKKIKNQNQLLKTFEERLKKLENSKN